MIYSKFPDNGYNLEIYESFKKFCYNQETKNYFNKQIKDLAILLMTIVV